MPALAHRRDFDQRRELPIPGRHEDFGGHFYLGQSGGSTGIGNYAPLIATLHGQDSTDGFINANLEFGSACNPCGGHGVHTSDTTGAPAHRWLAIMLP
jgi:hypothetical protein